MFLDVPEIGGFLERRVIPVEVFQPSVDVRVGVSDCHEEGRLVLCGVRKGEGRRAYRDQSCI